MFFILSKIVYWAIMPISLICTSLICSLIIKSDKWRRYSRWVGIALLLFFSNPFISKLCINAFEVDPIKIESIQQTYDWGIVLGGITDPNKPPFDRIHFNKGADRIVHAIQLYKLGYIKRILITGGSGVITFEGKEESHAIRDYALMCGIPDKDIFIEDESRNTRENALLSSKIISEQDSILLFTSAFHMHRAAACFRKAGLNIDMFPTDYYGGLIRATLDDTIIPTVYSIQLWSIMIKEWTGLMAYEVMGYI